MAQQTTIHAANTSSSTYNRAATECGRGHAPRLDQRRSWPHVHRLAADRRRDDQHREAARRLARQAWNVHRSASLLAQILEAREAHPEFLTAPIPEEA